MSSTMLSKKTPKLSNTSRNRQSQVYDVQKQKIIKYELLFTTVYEKDASSNKIFKFYVNRSNVIKYFFFHFISLDFLLRSEIARRVKSDVWTSGEPKKVPERTNLLRMAPVNTWHGTKSSSSIKYITENFENRKRMASGISGYDNASNVLYIFQL